MRELESSVSEGNDRDANKSKLITSLSTMWKKLAMALTQDLSNYLSNIETVKRAVIQSEDRTTRDLVNVVGNVGKYLFGFSTEKDVKEIAARIQTLKRAMKLTLLILRPINSVTLNQ